MSHSSPRHGKVRLHNGHPTIFINDRPELPFFYSPTHAYGGRWSWEEVPARNIRLFGETGIRLFQVDLYFEDIWSEESAPLDLSKAARQVQGVVDQVPDASVFVRIHVNAPFWWNEAHPEECTEYASGPIDDTIVSGAPMNNETGDTQRARRASLASARWKEVASQKLVEFCESFAQMPESNAVAGIHVCGGVYGEWHYWGFMHQPDLGGAMTAHFRQWLTERYGNDEELRQAWHRSEVSLATAEVPGLDEREATAEGYLRDPEHQRPILDYWHCQHALVADCIEHFCSLVREHWPRPVIIGVFYGYFFNMFNHHDSGGHLEIERIMKSPHIDYLSSPQCQWHETQGAGGAGYSRGLVDSARLHGKLWLDEIDHGARQEKYEVTPVGVELTPTPAYQAILRRSSAHPYLRGQGAWYYDFGLTKSRGRWDHPSYQKKIGEELKLYRSRVGRDYDSGADVLFIHSAEAMYYVNGRRSPIPRMAIDRSVERFYHSGAIADHFYDFDLELLDIQRYRLVVFPNFYHCTPSRREWIQKNLMCAGRTLLFQGLPGYTDGSRLGSDLVESLTGFQTTKIGQPVQPRFTLSGLEEHAATFERRIESAPTLAWVASQEERLIECSLSGSCLGAKRQEADCKVVVTSLPIASPAFYRWLARSSGAHVWNGSGDAIFGGYGLIAIHTMTGGERQLSLKDGGVVSHELPPIATSLFDATTGACMLKPNTVYLVQF